MEDFNKKDKGLEKCYHSVNELAEKLFIEHWNPYTSKLNEGLAEIFNVNKELIGQDINEYDLWDKCVATATYIYFNYDTVIETVNRFIHQDIERNKENNNED